MYRSTGIKIMVDYCESENWYELEQFLEENFKKQNVEIVNTDILFTTKEEYRDILEKEGVTIEEYLNYFPKYKKYALEFDEFTDDEIFDYLLGDIVKYRLFEDDYEYLDDDIMLKINN